MRMDSHLSAIREQGFTILEAQISDPLIRQLRSELAPFLAGEHFGRNDFEGFLGFLKQRQRLLWNARMLRARV